MKLLKDLECVEVIDENGGKKTVLTFYDEATDEIREVSYNLQSYSDGRWFDDPEKEQKVKDQVMKDLGLPWDQTDFFVGALHDVYDYGNFCSLHEVNVVAKFTEDMCDEIYTTEITEIINGDFAIKIHYEIDGKTYESKMTHGKYVGRMKKWLRNPQKEEKIKAKFKDQFGVPVEDSDSLIGKTIMVEVKCAFGKFYYGEIKKLKKQK